MVKYK